jgi:CubicO group peptidase (beta-lactamase class C family)
MKRTVLLAMGMVPMAVATTSMAANHASKTTRLRSEIDQYMTATAKVHHFMGSVLVARGDHVILAKGYGMADLKDHTPNTANTRFRIGSVTKQFTAMAIMQLQAEGKLNIKDPVCRYVPKCPADWRPIKLANLLDHTSGIPNYTDFPEFEKKAEDSITPTQLVDLFKNKPLDFKTGTKFSYSNSNYALLGYIIERLSGEHYGKFLQQHVFGPLRMTASGYGITQPNSKIYAKGYTPWVAGRHRPAAFWNGSMLYSAGALYSTVGDLYTWDRALAAGKLLPASLQKKLFTPRVHVDAQMQKTTGDSIYGYGWFISKVYGHLKYSHEGGVSGFTSMNSWYPKQHVYIVLLDNVQTGNVFKIDHDLDAIVFGHKYEVPHVAKAIHLPAKALNKFVGRYRLKPKVIMAITRKGDQLETQLTGQPALKVYPASRNTFFIDPKIVDGTIKFVLNSKGKVTMAVIHQNGSDIRLKKLGG